MCEAHSTATKRASNAASVTAQQAHIEAQYNKCIDLLTPIIMPLGNNVLTNEQLAELNAVFAEAKRVCGGDAIPARLLQQILNTCNQNLSHPFATRIANVIERKLDEEVLRVLMALVTNSRV